MPQKPARNWIVSREAAEIIGISLQTLGRYTKEGMFPNACLVYGTWLYWIGDVLRARNARNSNPPKIGRRHAVKPTVAPRMKRYRP